jgi:NAD(P)-dependent dehydrogenase (short-subunit alcohol dehydrogenase family)
MNGKVCIVTGSNTGIGKETAKGLAQRGAKVVLACRNVAKAEAARDEIASATGRRDIEVMTLDLASKSGIRRFVDQFTSSHDRLDVLVNNAGVFKTARHTTSDGLELTLGVNHVGTFLLTQGLLPLLEKSAPSRVVVVASKLHTSGKMNWEDLQCERRKYGGQAVYNDSKLANVLYAKALARRLEGKRVTVNALHPGVVATELIRDLPWLVVKAAQLFMLSPEKGAACSLHVASAPELEAVSGEYFDGSRVVPASDTARDTAAQERLWEITETLVA